MDLGRGATARLALVAALVVAPAGACGRNSHERGQQARLAQAESLLRANEPRQAAVALERALTGGSNPAISARLGMIYGELGDWKRAAAHLEQAQRAQPEVALGSLLALARAASGDVAGARASAPKHDDARRGSELGILVAAALAQRVDEQLALRNRLSVWRDQRKGDAPAELFAGLHALAASMRDADAVRQADAGLRSARLADPSWAAGLALVHQRQGQFAAAEQLLLRLVALHPEHREAWLRLADVAVARSDAALARRALAKLPPQANEPAWLAQLRARALLLDQKPEQACAVIAAALGAPADASRTELRLLQARCLAEGEHVQQAERVLDALAAQPDAAVRALLQRAELALMRGKPEDALTRLLPLVAANPDAVAVHYWIARAHEQQKAWPKAAQAYSEYLDRARDDSVARRSEVLHRLALVHRAQGNTARAERLFEAALAADPDAVESLRALVAQKPKDEAEARLRKQITLAVRSVPARNALAELLLASGRVQEAEQVHRDALAAEPGDVRAYTAYANFQLAQKQLPRAIELLERARELEPEQRTVVAMLAAAYAGAGQPARAVAAYEQLLRQTPTSVPVLNNLAFLYADALGRLDEALAHARKARALAPAWPEVADTLGWVLAKRGEHAEAVPLLEHAAQALPEDPRVLFHLGAAQLAAGQREPGKRTLRRALQSGTAFPESEQARALLAAK